MLKPSGLEGIRHKFIYKMEAEAFRATEGVRHKFTHKIEAEPLRARGNTAQMFIQDGSPQGRGGYGTNLHTKRKVKPSTQEGIQHKFIYKMEAEAPWARGDTAQIYIQNGS